MAFSLSKIVGKSRASRPIVSLVVVLAGVITGTWLGSTPRALAFPNVDGASFLNSHVSNPVFIEGATLQPTLALNGLSTFLGLPASAYGGAINGTAVPGGTLLLVNGAAGAIGNINFLDQSGIVASEYKVPLAPGSTAAQTFPSQRGAWVVVESLNGTSAVHFADTRSTIDNLESSQAIDVPQQTVVLTNSQLPVLNSASAGHTIGGAVFKPGVLAASAENLWSITGGQLWETSGASAAMNVEHVSNSAVVNASNSMRCAAVADQSGISTFAEGGGQAAVSQHRFGSPLRGDIQPVDSSGNAIYFVAESGSHLTVASATLDSNCHITATKFFSVMTHHGSNLARAWQWQESLVLAFSSPQWSLVEVDLNTGVPINISGTPSLPLKGSQSGKRHDIQFVGFSNGFVINDPASAEVGTVTVTSSGQRVAWFSRGTVFSSDAQAAATAPSQQQHQQSHSQGTTSKYVADPQCANVAPTQKIVFDNAQPAALASSVTLTFEQPSDGICASVLFKAFVSQGPRVSSSTNSNMQYQPAVAEECTSVDSISSGKYACTVKGLRASTRYSIQLASEWGPDNNPAFQTESDPINISTADVDVRDPAKLVARYDAVSEAWKLSWGKATDGASVWQINAQIHPDQTCESDGLTSTAFFSQRDGSLVIPMSTNSFLYGKNVSFTIQSGLTIDGQRLFTYPTEQTSCEWTPPSRSCFTSRSGSAWNQPIKITGSVPDSSSGASESLVNVSSLVPANCYLGQAQLVYQYQLFSQVSTTFHDCAGQTTWQAGYKNVGGTYPQTCFVGASPAAIKSGNAIVRMRYRIVLPDGSSHSDLSPGQRVAAGSLTDFSWPANGNVTATFSYVDGTSKNPNSLPDLKVALNGLVTANESTPEFSVPSIPLFSCTGPNGQSAQVSLGSIDSSVSTIAGVPTLRISDGGGANYDLIQAAGGKCTLTLELAIPTVDGGISTDTVLNQVPVLPGGSPLVMNSEYSARPNASWFAACLNGNVVTLSVDPNNSTCPLSSPNGAPGAITSPEGILVKLGSSTYQVQPDNGGFYGGSGTPPTTYTFTLSDTPTGSFSISFKWTYLGTTTPVTVYG
jgi:hypothetical protein